MTLAEDIRPQAAGQAASHPLDPLAPAEIEGAVAILRAQQALGERARFVTVTLHEPAKKTVLGFRPGAPIDREAFLVVLDKATGKTYEAVVSVTAAEVRSWRHIPDVQPALMLEEFVECEEAVKADPAFREALAKRGITDVDLLMVDPWSSGNYGIAAESGLRLARALSFLRSEPGDNGYARPIEGLVPIVDLTTMKVVKIEDHGFVPLAPNPGNYSPEAVGKLRDDLRPIEITQPEGTSFAVEGNEVRWQKWRFRVGFTPREGLVLHTVGYEDQGRLRPILYRASFCEMVVPYGDPGPTQYRKNAFDIGEYNVGMLTNSLELGCDCLGEIRYFDAVLADNLGRPSVLRNAVCLHEEDFGMLWKHVDWRTGYTEVRRSRRLVISFVATVGNYEYGFYWYLYQDGTIQCEVKLTGVLSTMGIAPGQSPEYGALIAPGLAAPNHQHFFNVRLDMSVDGEANSVYELDTEAPPLGPANPHGNAFKVKRTLLGREADAQRDFNPQAARVWKVANPAVRNSLGEPVSYVLYPDDNVPPFAHPEASVSKRAAFIRHHLWVTPYERTQRYAAGDYPNQHAGGTGLPEWTRANRPLEDTDVVLWYTFGHHHVPRPEDWPVMPVSHSGFTLKPVGFFEGNPGLDVPPPTSKNGHCCHHG